jgi:hypothetical protein
VDAHFPAARRETACGKPTSCRTGQLESPVATFTAASVPPYPARGTGAHGATTIRLLIGINRSEHYSCA